MVLVTLVIQGCDWAKDEPFTLEKLPAVVKGGYFDDPRDQRIYPIIHVGDMTWLGSNMRYVVAGSLCVDDCDRYGRMYTYSEAEQACPSGWKLPSKEEWQKISMVLNPARLYEFDDNFFVFYGYVLREDFSIRWPGVINTSDERSYKDKRVYFWSSSYDGANQGIFYIENNEGPIRAGYVSGSKNNRLSCLCVKEE